GQGLGVNGTNTTRNLLNSKIFDNTRCGIANFGTTSSGGSGTVNIDRCEFYNIKPSGSYGIIFFANKNLTTNILNTLIHGNETNSGFTFSSTSGIVFSYGANTTINLTNCTIVSNTTANPAHGSAITTQDNGKINVSNSVVWNNGGADQTVQFRVNTGTMTVSNTASNQPNFTTTYSDLTNYLLDSENTAATGPNFSEDFSLLAVSPLINRGDNTGISGFDINGESRIWNNGVVDIGAYEFSAFALKNVTYLGVSDMIQNVTIPNITTSTNDQRKPTASWIIKFYSDDKFENELNEDNIKTLTTDSVVYVKAIDSNAHWLAANSASFKIIESGLKLTIDNFDYYYAEGATVNGIVIPNQDMFVSKLNYTGLTDVNETFGGKYSFTMPNNDVKITVNELDI
ncbi:MAG: choice-of-anchor Q domain-containing protein, partial [Lentisphaeria bacterium]